MFLITLFFFFYYFPLLLFSPVIFLGLVCMVFASVVFYFVWFRSLFSLFFFFSSLFFFFPFSLFPYQ